MQVFHSIVDPKLVNMLRHGAIGVMPTDTLYGVVASIHSPAAIQRLYEVRGRSPLKGCITLIADIAQTEYVMWTDGHRALAEQYWPGPVSIVLPVSGDTPQYLHPIDGSLAFRLPNRIELRTLMRLTGPLFAPSANMAGEPPASTLAEAQAYFGDRVDFYVDGGDLSGNMPSALIRLSEQGVDVLRGELPTERIDR